jgi:hypothetical protein
MMRFIYKWRQNGVFRVNLSLLVDHEQTDGACSLVAARKSCADEKRSFSTESPDVCPEPVLAARRFS